MTENPTDAPEPTSCPVETCEDTVDFADLIPHLYQDHDATELCEALANLASELSDEQATHAKTCDNMEITSESFTDTIGTLESRLDSVRTAARVMQEQRDSLLAELAQVRSAAPLLVSRDDLTELDAILTAERYRLDKGDGTPVPQPRWGANVRIAQAVQAALTGGDPPRPSPDHSAVYMDGDRQVWSEYKTVPESDAVVPLVWANEVTSSRANLADDGVVLRIVGWTK